MGKRAKVELWGVGPAVWMKLGGDVARDAQVTAGSRFLALPSMNRTVDLIFTAVSEDLIFTLNISLYVCTYITNIHGISSWVVIR